MDWSILSGLDIALLTVIGASAIVGVILGLSGETGRLLGLAGAVGAGYGSVRLWQRAADSAVPPEAASYWHGIVVILGVLVTAVLAGWLVRTLVKRSVQVIVRQPADMIFGLLFGAFRGLLITVIFFFLASYVVTGSAEYYIFEHSQLGKASRPAVTLLRDFAGALRSAPDPEPELLDE